MGAIDIWTPSPPSLLQTIAYANVNPTLGPVLLTADQLAKAFDPHGDFEISLRMVVNFNQSGRATEFYFFEAQTPAGKVSLRFIPGFLTGSVYNAIGTYEFLVNDVVIFSGATSIIANVATLLSFAAAQEIVVHAWFKPWLAAHSDPILGAYDTAGVQIEVMGCTTVGQYNSGGPVRNYVSQPATGGPLTPPTAFALGSRLDGTLAMDATIDQCIFKRTGTWYRQTTGYILCPGDSNFTSWLQQPPDMSCVRTVPAYRTQPKIITLARSGALIQDQTGSYQATGGGDGSDYFYRDPQILAIVNETAINNVISGAISLPDIEATLTAAVAAQRAANPHAILVWCLMSPCAGALTIPGTPALWTAVNAFIATLPVDYVVSGHVAVLGDGASPPNLLPQYQAYDVSPPAAIKDGLHLDGTMVPLNTSGRGVLASHILSEALIPAGIWTG